MVALYCTYQPHVEDILWSVSPHVGVQNDITVPSIELPERAGVKFLKFMLLNTPDLRE